MVMGWSTDPGFPLGMQDPSPVLLHLGILYQLLGEADGWVGVWLRRVAHFGNHCQSLPPSL